MYQKVPFRWWFEIFKTELSQFLASKEGFVTCADECGLHPACERFRVSRLNHGIMEHIDDPKHLVLGTAVLSSLLLSA